jgi:hypothetical protein
MSTPKSSNDIFEEALDAKIVLLKECQKSHNATTTFNGESHGSCAPCPKIIGCDTRRQYVSAVYNSMSKGDTGGFEF